MIPVAPPRSCTLWPLSSSSTSMGAFAFEPVSCFLVECGMRVGCVSKLDATKTSIGLYTDSRASASRSGYRSRKQKCYIFILHFGFFFFFLFVCLRVFVFVFTCLFLFCFCLLFFFFFRMLLFLLCVAYCYLFFQYVLFFFVCLFVCFVDFCGFFVPHFRSARANTTNNLS